MFLYVIVIQNVCAPFVVIGVHCCTIAIRYPFNGNWHEKRKTIENLHELAELTQQVQADRIEIVLEERSDNYFPPMSKAMMETRSGLTRRKLDDAIGKMEAAGHQFTKNNANHYSITLEEAHMLMDAAEVPKFHERKKTMAISRGLSTYKTKRVVRVNRCRRCI